MKKTLFMLTALIFILGSCQKNKIKLKNLDGQWKVVRSELGGADHLNINIKQEAPCFWEDSTLTYTYTATKECYYNFKDNNVAEQTGKIIQSSPDQAKLFQCILEMKQSESPINNIGTWNTREEGKNDHILQMSYSNLSIEYDIIKLDKKTLIIRKENFFDPQTGLSGTIEVEMEKQ